MMLADDDGILFRPLLGGGQLSDEYVIKLMLRSRGVGAEDRELANSIFPKSGNYLGLHKIGFVIRADYSDDEICNELSKEMAFFERLSVLLPALFGYLQIKMPRDVAAVLNLVDDCHHDFAIVAVSQRKDKIRRESIAGLTNASEAVEAAIQALKQAHWSLPIEFDRAHIDFAKAVESVDQNFCFNDFLRELGFCRDVLKISSHRAAHEDNYLGESHNQIRTHVVECAYRISVWFGGPPLVTTPGSEFSAFCSILYEIISGVPEESLAGAINRYGRSDGRRELDQYEKAQLAENEEDPSATDNFKAARDAARRALEECELYRRMLQPGNFEDVPKRLVSILFSVSTQRANDALNSYGPNIVWADQRAVTADDAERGAKLSDTQVQVRQLEIKLGQVRRQMRVASKLT